MKALEKKLNILQVNEAFSKQASVFDKEYAANSIIQYKRKRVRSHVEKLIGPGGSILEINSGTGEDALYFAKQGYKVHATDLSQSMQDQLYQKINSADLSHLVTQEVCSFNELSRLKNSGPYDLLFSNFGGLNCTGELDKVLHSFSPLLNPGAKLCLVIITKFCLWETLYFFKGEFKTATRRFFSRNGQKATIEQTDFQCWYYNPGYIKKNLKKDFRLLQIEGLCITVPPSYRERFVEKHPRLYTWLMWIEERIKYLWPWRTIGDYFIISLEKK